ncbi:hypothetical protein BVRB_2g037460 [Beta vulgaris subsp. vulgaris]|nr:hypothetical protein BVRB_2g037460 [Beta vulgaris subsp. vulgaris]
MNGVWMHRKQSSVLFCTFSSTITYRNNLDKTAKLNH